MAGERRDFSRVPVPFRVRYRLYRELGESWRQIATVNISAGGMRVRSEEPLEVGGRLEVQITLSSAATPLTVQGCVVWSRSLGAGVNEIGVQFTDLTPVQQEQVDGIVLFLMKSTPPPPPDA